MLKFEQLPESVKRAGLGALLTSELLGAAACTPRNGVGPSEQTIPIRSCHAKAVTQKPAKPKTINFRVNAQGGMSGNKPTPEKIKDKVAKASIFILNSRTGSHQSGVLVKDAKGREVVVASAHGIGTDSVRDYILYGPDGKPSATEDACYHAQETEDKKHQLVSQTKIDEGAPADADLIFLLPSRSLGAKPLPIDPVTDLKAGEWYTVAGTPGSNEPRDRPKLRFLQAIALGPPTKQNDGSYQERLLAGLGGPDGKEKNTTVEPGMSGGPIVNGAGELSGITRGHHTPKESIPFLRDEYDLGKQTQLPELERIVATDSLMILKGLEAFAKS